MIRKTWRSCGRVCTRRQREKEAAPGSPAPQQVLGSRFQIVCVRCEPMGAQPEHPQRTETTESCGVFFLPFNRNILGELWEEGRPKGECLLKCNAAMWFGNDKLKGPSGLRTSWILGSSGFPARRRGKQLSIRHSREATRGLADLEKAGLEEHCTPARPCSLNRARGRKKPQTHLQEHLLQFGIGFFQIIVNDDQVEQAGLFT